jgi:hypothetical protein
MGWYTPVLAILGKRVRILAISQRLSPKVLQAQFLVLKLVNSS